MSSLTHAARRSIAAALLWTIAGCSSLPTRSQSPALPSQELTQTERVAHVLSRLTFGARSGDAERVAAMGIDRWIDQQLHPDLIPDSAVIVALAPIVAWSQPPSSAASISAMRTITMVPATPPKDSAGRAALIGQLKQFVIRLSPNEYFAAGKIIHAQLGERQLLEVVSDFWENHFSVYNAKMPSPEALIVLDRDVLRPRALGKFRDLLGAVAHSPAMLFYLDNQLSRSHGLNENYARELLELHTLGVDGGYTQQDVIEVARALTGWTIGPMRDPSVFAFQKSMHDTGAKTVLGHTLAAGRGIEDGEEVLDILAHHPSTAHHIALKLARRLVSDDPPPALVDRAAATFTRTDGDIAQVVRTIITSPEFFSRAAFRAKVKTPFELVVSARRALNAPADTTTTTARLVGQLGQPIFGHGTPEGWPDAGGAWMNSGTMYQRIRFGYNMADGQAAFAPVEVWPPWPRLSPLPLDRQVDGVVKNLLGGVAAPATREVMLAAGPGKLRDLIGIAFASPEFQRR